MSMTPFTNGHADDRYGSDPGERALPSRDERARPLLMLLEPRHRGKAQRIIGKIAKHQPVPGSGLVEPPHLLSQFRQPVVKLRPRLEPERLDVCAWT